jgi:hypothetical protein
MRRYCIAALLIYEVYNRAMATAVRALDEIMCEDQRNRQEKALTRMRKTLVYLNISCQHWLYSAEPG